MSVVSASISRSSWDRSEKPGRTCLACSLSRAATAQVSAESGNGERAKRTLGLCLGKDFVNLICVVYPAGR